MYWPNVKKFYKMYAMYKTLQMLQSLQNVQNVQNVQNCTKIIFCKKVYNCKISNMVIPSKARNLLFPFRHSRNLEPSPLAGEGQGEGEGEVFRLSFLCHPRPDRGSSVFLFPSFACPERRVRTGKGW